MRISKEKLKRLREIEYSCIKEAINNALEPDCVVDDVVEASNMEIKGFRTGDIPIYGEKDNKTLVNILMKMERAEKKRLRDLVERIKNYCLGGLTDEEKVYLAEQSYKLAYYTMDKGFQDISKQFLELYTMYTTSAKETQAKNVERIVRGVLSGYARRNLYTGRDYKSRAEQTITELIEGRFGEDLNIDIDGLVNSYNNQEITVYQDKNYHTVKISNTLSASQFKDFKTRLKKEE